MFLTKGERIAVFRPSNTYRWLVFDLEVVLFLAFYIKNLYALSETIFMKNKKTGRAHITKLNLTDVSGEVDDSYAIKAVTKKGRQVSSIPQNQGKYSQRNDKKETRDPQKRYQNTKEDSQILSNLFWY